MSNPFKSLADSLGPNIAALEARAKASLDLTQRVRNALADPEKNHVVAASYKGDDLVVLVDSAAWCTRIRYTEAELSATLRAAGEKVFARIKIRVGLPGRGDEPSNSD